MNRNRHQRFIDHPAHLAALDGQRYVVLRPTGILVDAFVELRSRIETDHRDQQISYPAQPHVTLAGVGGPGTDHGLAALVETWALEVPPLCLEVERVNLFPAPFQIVILQVRRTPELLRAMITLRQSCRENGLRDLAAIPPEAWTFHASVAYCAELDAPAWERVVCLAQSIAVPRTSCTVVEVEVVGFSGGHERRIAVVPLSS